MTDELIAIGEGVAFAAIVLAWLLVAKLVADRRVRGEYAPNREIMEAGNLAVALRRAGLYLGLAIGLLGALDGGGGRFSDDALELVVDGAALTALLLVARLLTDWVVVPGIRTDEAVQQGNVAVGAVELGIFVATGLVANGSFSGQGGGLISAFVFFALGQVALLVIVRVYEMVTPWQVIDEVKGGNAAAGVMLAGTLVAFGFILRASVAGPFVAWGTDIAAFGISATAGILLLMVLQLPIDRLFLPGSTLRRQIEVEQNGAAIVVAASVKIALALIVQAVML